MWIWSHQLEVIGFRRCSDRYWQCKNRYALSVNDHISLFPWNELPMPGRGQYLVEMDAFHVTIPIGFDHIHFYYHDHGENQWEAAGHTSRRRIRRLGCHVLELRSQADNIAASLIEALGGSFNPRDENVPP